MSDDDDPLNYTDPSGQVSISLSQPTWFPQQRRLDVVRLARLTRLLLRLMRQPFSEISLMFVSKGVIQQLNTEHRGLEKPTDVLSFPLCEWSERVRIDDSLSARYDDDLLLISRDDKQQEPQGPSDGPPVLLGDVVICPEVALQNAESIGQSVDREVVFLLVHGMLHLLGHDHMQPDEEDIMTGEQKKVFDWLDSALGGNYLQEHSLWGRQPGCQA